MLTEWNGLHKNGWRPRPLDGEDLHRRRFDSVRDDHQWAAYVLPQRQQHNLSGCRSHGLQCVQCLPRYTM